jgi:type I restriction enzyme S subunit
LALPIIIPPLALLQRADGILGDNFDLISTLLNANCTLRAARDLLLPKLISGEIDLSGAEREIERARDQVAAE